MRIGEVGVGDFLAFENEIFKLVVSAENVFAGGVGEKVLHLHLHGRSTTATLGVFGLNNNHRVLANHEHVTDAKFLCGFH